jgi:hypothetical protein
MREKQMKLVGTSPWLVVSLSTLLLVLYFLLVPSLPQDMLYHQFADQRHWLFIPNAWNVLSNLPFLLVGCLGLKTLANSNKSLCHHNLLTGYRLFFIGVALTCLGSSYYHWHPDNHSLIYDRLAISFSFMALFSVYCGEFIAENLGRKLLYPAIILGCATVILWGLSEYLGAGDLRPYLLTQLLPMLLLPVFFICYRWSYSHQRACWLLIIFYLLAKITECYDLEIFTFTGVISGHSLKHLFAALAAYTVFWLLDNRRKTN